MVKMQSLLFLAISALMVNNILSFIKIDAIVDTKFSPLKEGIGEFNSEAIKCDLCGDTCFRLCTDVISMDGLEKFRRCCANYFKKRSSDSQIGHKPNDFQWIFNSLKEPQTDNPNEKTKTPTIKWKIN